MLALALERSGTSVESRRRLRLLRELEATVAELEDEGYKNEDVMGPLRAAVAAGWETAPPDAVAEARADARAGKEKPLSAEDVREMLGDALGRLDIDLSKWRFRIKDEGEK